MVPIMNKSTETARKIMAGLMVITVLGTSTHGTETRVTHRDFSLQSHLYKPQLQPLLQHKSLSNPIRNHPTARTA
jgi:hypothetical protein